MPNMTPEQWKSKGRSFPWKGQSIFFVESEAAPSTKPVLLCLHGFPTSSFDFHPLWQRLAKQYRVIAFDMLGMGYSSKPASWTYTCMEQADIGQALLQSLGVDEFSMLAHDLGDTVGQELLARHNEGSLHARLSRAVFLNGGLDPHAHRPILVQKLLLTPLGPLIVRLMGFRQFRQSLYRVCSARLPEEEVVHAWQILNVANGRLRLNQLIRYIPERLLHRERWVGALSGAKCPLFLIDGVQDPVSGGHLADRVAQLAPNVTIFRLQGLGHYPHLEDPDATWDVLKGCVC